MYFSVDRRRQLAAFHEELGNLKANHMDRDGWDGLTAPRLTIDTRDLVTPLFQELGRRKQTAEWIPKKVQVLRKKWEDFCTAKQGPYTEQKHQALLDVEQALIDVEGLAELSDADVQESERREVIEAIESEGWEAVDKEEAEKKGIDEGWEEIRPEEHPKQDLDIPPTSPPTD